MRFHVLGIGSIGTLISHHLRNTTTLPISLIFRRAAKLPTTRPPDDSDSSRSPFRLVVKRGTTRSESTGYDIEKIHDGTDHLHRQAITAGSSDGPNGKIDSLVVCLKTQDTLPAIRILAPRISPSSVITLLQNGMGVYDQLCLSVFPDPSTRPQFILGTTTHGVTKTNSYGVVKHMSPAGEGEIKFGVVPDPRGEVNMSEWLWRGTDASGEHITTPPSSPVLPLPPPPRRSLGNLHQTLNTLLGMSELSPSLLPMPHLHHQLLLKLAVNSVINPLTAILGHGSLPNGALLASTPGYKLIRMVLHETSAILTAYIESLSHPHSPPVDVIRLFSPESLEKRCLAVIRQTRDNTSSMADDIARGGMTEIESINGYLVDLATRLNVDAPTHKMLIEMVKYVSAMSNPSSDVPERYRLTTSGTKANPLYTSADANDSTEAISTTTDDIDPLRLEHQRLSTKEVEAKLALSEQRRKNRSGRVQAVSQGAQWMKWQERRQKWFEAESRKKYKAYKKREAAELEARGSSTIDKAEAKEEKE